MLARHPPRRGLLLSHRGEPHQAPVVGATQDNGVLTVTVMSFVDPAPLATDESEPDAGEKLVAVRVKVHNTGDDDYLVDPIMDVKFGVGATSYDNALTKTSAGVMLDQVSLPPDATVVGFVTARVPEGSVVDSVSYVSFHNEALRWQVADGTVHTPPPPPPPLPATPAHHPGEPVVISDDDQQLTVTEIGLASAPAHQSKVDAGTGEQVVEVDFTAKNTGGPLTEDSDLRRLVLYDAADEPVQAHVYSTPASVERPLAPGAEANWPVQFVVPAGFQPDHVTFTPEFGDTTTTTWTLNR